MFNKDKFEEFLLEKKILAHKLEPITLASGKKSSWYVSGRIISQTLSGLEEMADMMIGFMLSQNIDFTEIDAVVGVPEGATELGNAISRRLIQKSLIKDKLYFLRVRPKEHGDPSQRVWINGQAPKKIILLEDTVSTGGSIMKIMDRLKEVGVEVVALVFEVDRLHLSDGKTAKELFVEKGINFFSITDAVRMLPKILDKIEGENLRGEIKNRLNGEYKIEYDEVGRQSPINL